MANATGKGTEFEYAICNLFSRQGYFVRRAIPIMSKSNQDITDIDVLGVLFSHPFQKHKIVCDCKNKNKSKPYERILWAKGLGSYLNATDVFVAIPKLNQDILQFAKESDVDIISQENISVYEKYKEGYSDFSYYSKFFDTIESAYKAHPIAQSYISTLKKQYIIDNPYAGINTSLSVINKLVNLQKEENKLTTEITKYIFCEAVVLVAYSLLSICSDVFGMPINKRNEYITAKLTYGNTDSDYIKKLIDNLTDYANVVVNSSVPKEYLKNNRIVEPLVIPPPHYTNNLIGLVDRAYNNPDWYIDLTRSIDYLLFEFLLKNTSFSMEKFKRYVNFSMEEEKLKACKNLLVFISGSSRVSLNDFWEAEKNFIPQ